MALVFDISMYNDNYLSVVMSPPFLSVKLASIWTVEG